MPHPFDLFSLVYASPLPEGRRMSTISMDPLLTALSWSTTDPLGYNGFAAGYRIDGQPTTANLIRTPFDVQGLGHVEIWVQGEFGFKVSEGRIQRWNQPGGQRVSAVSGSGYGSEALKDVYVFAPNDTQALTSGELVRRVIGNAAPLLSIDEMHFQDPGGAKIYTLQEQHARYPNQAFDQVIKAGADSLEPIVFTVYEDRKVRFHPRLAPVDDFGNYAPDYRVPLNPQFVDIGFSAEKLIGAAVVQFTPPGGTQDATKVQRDPFFSVLHGGLVKVALINQSTLTADQAKQLRNRYVHRYSQPIATATVKITDDFPLLDRNGAPVPFYRCRAGQWALFGEDVMLEITATKNDASSRSVDFTATNE